MTFVIVIIGMVMNAKFGKESEFFPNMDPDAAVGAIEGPHGELQTALKRALSGSFKWTFGILTVKY